MKTAGQAAAPAHTHPRADDAPRESWAGVEAYPAANSAAFFSVFSLPPRTMNPLLPRRTFLRHAALAGGILGLSTLASGRDVLFDIDWQGTQQLREKARGDLVAVFVLPPSIPELERRLKSRAQDDYETIHRRMAKAADEMSHWAEYDYVVINRDLDQAFADVKAVLAAERLKRERQPGLSDFVRGLQAKL